MKVTVCQMSNARSRFEGDWRNLAEHVKKESSDLVLLPEMTFSEWFCAKERFDREVWEDAVSDHAAWLGRLGELGASVVAGTMLVDKGGRRLNQGFVWSGSRARGVQYKNYLPNERGFYEARWYHRGHGFSPFSVDDWKGGFLICSDLWSMNNARLLGKKGAHILFSPRTTGVTVKKWQAGGMTAAVISGAYSLSSNRSGTIPAVEFGGAGWIIDPDGNVLGVTSKETPFVTAEVDLKKADAAKKTYPRDALRPD
jgi:N-carbamoylputrescine amidase